MAHLALAVHDEERSRGFYERYFGFDAEKCRDPDGYVIELAWESGDLS